MGVHAFAAENVWTRDPDADPTKSLPEKEVEASWVSVRRGELRRFVTVSAVEVGPQPCLHGRTKKTAFGAALAVTSARRLVCREQVLIMGSFGSEIGSPQLLFVRRRLAHEGL